MATQQTHQAFCHAFAKCGVEAPLFKPPEEPRLGIGLRNPIERLDVRQAYRRKKDGEKKKTGLFSPI